MKHKNYDVIVDWAEGKTIQVRCIDTTWIDVLPQSEVPNFNAENLEWRVKPQPTIIKYRLALMRNTTDPCYIDSSVEYYTAVFGNSETFINEFINSELFVKWVSDWLELEVPE